MENLKIRNMDGLRKKQSNLKIIANNFILYKGRLLKQRAARNCRTRPSTE